MTNKEIARVLKITADLLEIHDENPFRIRTYTNAALVADRHNNPLENLSEEALERVDGIGKGMAKTITVILETGSFDVLEQLKAKTPAGVIEISGIKGLGPKKVKTLWRDLQIESIDALREACTTGRIAATKGFGEKTQESILENLRYLDMNRGKALFSDAEEPANKLLELLKTAFPDTSISFTGELRRKSDIVTSADILIENTPLDKIATVIGGYESIQIDLKRSGPFTLRGTFKSAEIPWLVRIVPEEQFYQKLVLFSGSDGHLASIQKGGNNLAEYTMNNLHGDEESYYTSLDLPWIIPEIREEIYNQDQLTAMSRLELIEDGDLRGAFHNHSTYSDGKNSLREMAEKCISLGYEYLGISDHSQSAFYANGLQEYHVLKQFEEIDKLNEELTPFTIFKGIESDILNDGSLDYKTEILAKFDFIVASIHSNLNMDVDKATTRLLKAIENPYTTMLGHATGRLLLKRPGYPLDHTKIIDACANHGVMIEINSNPWRLDIDWRWVSYALQKGMMLSINPDAHEVDGLSDMRYGVISGRKGGLTKAMTFNAKPLAEVKHYLAERKSKIKSL